MKQVKKDIFLKLMFNIQKQLLGFHSDLAFLNERKKNLGKLQYVLPA